MIKENRSINNIKEVIEEHNKKIKYKNEEKISVIFILYIFILCLSIFIYYVDFKINTNLITFSLFVFPILLYLSFLNENKFIKKIGIIFLNNFYIEKKYTNSYFENINTNEKLEIYLDDNILKKRNIILEHLLNKKNKIIMLSGSYGTLKTSFYFKFIEPLLIEQNKKVLYFSFYGQTVKDLEKEIIDDINKNEFNSFLFIFLPIFIKDSEKIISFFTSIIKKEYILIIDDFERKNKNEDWNQIYGFLNKLKRNNIANILLICNNKTLQENNKTLQENTDFKESYDKNIDENIEFNNELSHKIFINKENKGKINGLINSFDLYDIPENFNFREYYKLIKINNDYIDYLKKNKSIFFTLEIFKQENYPKYYKIYFNNIFINYLKILLNDLALIYNIFKTNNIENNLINSKKILNDEFDIFKHMLNILKTNNEFVFLKKILKIEKLLNTDKNDFIDSLYIFNNFSIIDTLLNINEFNNLNYECNDVMKDGSFNKEKFLKEKFELFYNKNQKYEEYFSKNDLFVFYIYILFYLLYDYDNIIIKKDYLFEEYISKNLLILLY